MANLNAPHGFTPIQSPYGAIQKNPYTITASYATALYIGDPVVRTSAGTISRATAGSAGLVVGVITEIFDADGVPVNYYPASSSTTYTANVADDPDQEFEAQDDGDTTQLALADLGAGVDFVAGSGGSTITGLSSFMIDSSSAAAASASKQMILVRQLAEPNNAIGANCRWVIRFARHQNGNFAVSAGI